jgi:hypothetical protein
MGFWGGLVPENAGDHAVLAGMVEAGALGFKSFISPSGGRLAHGGAWSRLAARLASPGVLTACAALPQPLGAGVQHGSAQPLPAEGCRGPWPRQPRYGACLSPGRPPALKGGGERGVPACSQLQTSWAAGQAESRPLAVVSRPGSGRRVRGRVSAQGSASRRRHRRLPKRGPGGHRCGAAVADGQRGALHAALRAAAQCGAQAGELGRAGPGRPAGTALGVLGAAQPGPLVWLVNPVHAAHPLCRNCAAFATLYSISKPRRLGLVHLGDATVPSTTSTPTHPHAHPRRWTPRWSPPTGTRRT